MHGVMCWLIWGIWAAYVVALTFYNGTNTQNACKSLRLHDLRVLFLINTINGTLQNINGTISAQVGDVIEQVI